MSEQDNEPDNESPFPEGSLPAALTTFLKLGEPVQLDDDQLELTQWRTSTGYTITANMLMGDVTVYDENDDVIAIYDITMTLAKRK